MKNFINRRDAALQLAQKLLKYRENPDTVIIGIPRGGIELGFHLSHALHLPLSFILTKKIGHPANCEYAIGVAGLDTFHVDDESIDPAYIKKEVALIQEKLKARAKSYAPYGAHPIKNQTIIIVDDGIATGRTLMLTLQLIRKEGPKKIVLAIPVSPIDSLNKISSFADEVICLNTPQDFYAIGQFYDDFTQVEDAKVIEYLKKSWGIK